MIILIGLLFLVTLAADTSIFERKPEKPANTNNEELCKLFTQKAEEYQKTMRDDGYAQTTLQSYKDRAALYCKQ